jgi:hypothetical protein
VSARAKLIVVDVITVLREKLGFHVDPRGDSPSHDAFRAAAEAAVEERLRAWRLTQSEEPSEAPPPLVGFTQSTWNIPHGTHTLRVGPEGITIVSERRPLSPEAARRRPR